MKVVIIDDKELDARLLEAYVGESPGLELAGLFTNPLEGMRYLATHVVDVLLLDQEMADISGLNLARSLVHPPSIVMVTSHTEVAAESFDLDVVDFLVKPVSFERFLRAINKVSRRRLVAPVAAAAPVAVAHEANQQHYSNTISLKSGREVHRVILAEILYLEASKNYVVVYLLNGKKLLVQEGIQNMEDLLATRGFVRAHRSYLIGIKHIKKVERHQVWVGEVPVPLGRMYRKQIDLIIS